MPSSNFFKQFWRMKNKKIVNVYAFLKEGEGIVKAEYTNIRAPHLTLVYYPIIEKHDINFSIEDRLDNAYKDLYIML